MVGCDAGGNQASFRGAARIQYDRSGKGRGLSLLFFKRSGLKLEKDTEKAAVEGRTARAGRFTRSLDWLEVALLAAMAPIFVFPKRERIWLFLVFPLIWTLRWATGREGIEGRGARTAIDAAMLIICIQLLISTLVSGDVLSGLPKIAGVLLRDSCLLCPGKAAEIKGTDPAGIAVFLAGGLAITAIGGMGTFLAKEPFFAKVVTVVFRKVPQKNWGFQAAELGLNPNAVAGMMTLFVPLCVVLAAWGMMKMLRTSLERQVRKKLCLYCQNQV